MATLEGKAVIVTGGGTGIGAACAAKLAADGLRQGGADGVGLGRCVNGHLPDCGTGLPAW